MRLFLTTVLLFALSGLAVPQKAQPDKYADMPAEMVRARQALLTAKNELTHAGEEWGGHRVTAITHIDQALTEIQLSMDWARQHKRIK